MGKAKNNVVLAQQRDYKWGTQAGKESFVKAGGSLELFTD